MDEALQLAAAPHHRGKTAKSYGLCHSCACGTQYHGGTETGGLPRR